MKCTRYYFNHLMFYFQPAVLIFPIAVWIDESAIQISTLWFHAVWYWRNQKATWLYWEGWMSNHDKRIDDATCSKCGYKHSTVFGNPELLSDYCPECNSKMNKI